MLKIAVFFGLIVASSLALPVELQADEIPVQVVLAESAPAVLKEVAKAVLVAVEKPSPAVVEAVKVESKESEEEVSAQPAVEPKAVETPVVVAVEEKPVETPKAADDLETPAEKKPEDAKTAPAAAAAEDDKSKDLETQSSVWGGWSSAPAAAVVSTGWPLATTYHTAGWAHPRSYSHYPTASYYHPTAHYSHSYWPAAASYSYVPSGWW